MSKGKSFISEIGKYFKENDATSAMNQIMDITQTLNLSEKRLFGEESRCNCKYSQLQVLQLLLLFPCFMIKNAFNYSASSLYGIANCGKDVFYRFLSREDYKITVQRCETFSRRTIRLSPNTYAKIKLEGIFNLPIIEEEFQAEPFYMVMEDNEHKVSYIKSTYKKCLREE